jgi:hypothetical protein
MGRARPCLIRIVAACPRSRLIRVCASHNKTFPGRGAFILIQPGRRGPCSQDWPGYAGSERPFWMPLTAASRDRRPAAGSRPKYLPGPSASAGPPPPQALRLRGPSTPSKRTAGSRIGKRTVGPRTVSPGANGAIRPTRRRRQSFKGSKGRGRPAQTTLLWESLATVLPMGATHKALPIEGCRRGSAP